MIRLSNLQYSMLKAFTDHQKTFHMSIQDAQHFDQRPFRSMLMRGYVNYQTGRGFHLTVAGVKAFKEFTCSDCARKNPALPLTRYFDPVAYGLHDPYRKGNVRLMKKTA